MKLIAILLIQLILSGILFAQDSTKDFDPAIMGESDLDRDSNDTETDYTSYWLYLNPGFVITVEELRISKFLDVDSRTSAIMRAPAQGSWYVDVATPDIWSFGSFGFHLLAYGKGVEYRKQIYREPIEIYGEQGTARLARDVGTRIQGYYVFTAPVLYLGSKDRYDGFRIGVGYGPMYLRLSGSALLSGDAERALFFALNSEGRNDLLSQLQERILFSDGFDLRQGDPIVSYLIWNLNQQNNLETYGQYLVFRDGITLRGFNLFLLDRLLNDQQYDRFDFNFFEAYALINLSRENINITRKAQGTFFGYMSIGTSSLCPTDACLIRFAYGTSRFRIRNLDFNFSTLLFSYSIRLRI